MPKGPESLEDFSQNGHEPEGRTHGFFKRHNHILPSTLSPDEVRKSILFPENIYGKNPKSLQGYARSFGRKHR